MIKSRTNKIPKNRKDKINFWSAAVQAWERSGLTQREFCQNQGLCFSTFKYWKKDLSGIEPVLNQAQELVPIAISIKNPSPQQSKPPCTITMTVRSRYQLEICDGFLPATLEQIICVLERMA